MNAAQLLELATTIALALQTLALAFALARLVLGPTLPDRVLALDLLATVAIGYVAVIAIRSGFELYLDIAIALALLGFLSTVALARYVLHRAADLGEDK